MNTGQAGSQASTAIAGLATNGTSKLQVNNLNGVAIGSPEAFSLPGGGGYLNWSFFLQKKDAVWHKVLTIMLQASKVAAGSFVPVLNLSKVPKESWDGLNSMMGGLMPVTNPTQAAAKSTYWVFTPGLVQVAASQKAYEDPMYADGIPMIGGAQYVVVPQEQYKAFGDVMGKMMMTKDGYIVPSDTKPTDVYDAAYNTPALDGISYLNVHCEAIAESTESCAAGGTAKTQQK
jgi:hypothetical protein